jgi:ankyrin repeat protein
MNQSATKKEIKKFQLQFIESSRANIAAALRLQLLDAVKTDKAKQLQSSLDSGASTAITDDNGDTLLQIACRRAAGPDCVLLLLGSGVDIEATGTNGCTALHTAAKWSAEAAIKMLLAKGAFVHATDRRGQTPLHFLRTAKLSHCYWTVMLTSKHVTGTATHQYSMRVCPAE